MPKLYPGYRDEIRKKIVSEAFEVFLAKGFEKTTMDEIAARLGVTKPAIYRYYKNKEALFLASVTETMMAEFEKTFASSFASGDLMAGAGLFFDELLEFDRKYAALGKDVDSIISRDVSLREGISHFHSAGLELMRHFFWEHKKLGTIRTIMDDNDLTAICTALANGLISSVGHGLDPAEAKRLWLLGFAKLADIESRKRP
jgi:AcrR family transcriptional regulator